MNHIELTIEHMEARAERLERQAQGFRDAVTLLRNLEVISEPEVLTQRRKGAETQGGRKEPAMGLQAALRSIAESMPGPFRAADLSKASKFVYQKKQCADFLSNGARLGFLKREGCGVFTVRLRGPEPGTAGGRGRAVPAPKRGRGREPGSGREPLRLAALGLPKQFRAGDLAAAGKVDIKQAHNWLGPALKHGWVERAGFGLYERTGKCGTGEKGKPDRGAIARPPTTNSDTLKGGQQAEKGPAPSEKERAYRDLRAGMGKIHVPRIGEGMRPDGEEES